MRFARPEAERLQISMLSRGWKRHRKHSQGQRIIAPVCFAVFMLLLWHLLATKTGVSSFILPSPSEVFSRAVVILGSDFSFWTALGITFWESIMGALLGATVGLPFAFTIHHSSWIRSAVEPFLGASQAIPTVVLAPLLLLWLPSNQVAITVLCAIMVFFPILVSTTVGLRHLDSDVVAATRLDGASTWQSIYFVEFPMVLPALMAGLRNGFTLSVTGSVVGEMVLGGKGMGTLIILQSHSLDTVSVFVSLICMCTLAACVYLFIYNCEKRSKTINSL